MRLCSPVFIVLMAVLAACSETDQSTPPGSVPVTQSDAPTTSQTGPLVQSASGLLRGTTVGSIDVFRGIPYAKPPIGNLRWRAPEEFPAWTGERDATEFGAPCVQPAVPPPFGVSVPWSEDCLTLNIYTPAVALEDGVQRPVLFWIHGGAFLIGSGSQPVYEGSDLAALNVVVVTINYRMGALGFLAHPSLSAEQPDGPLGNYGLLDQIAALRWVHDNIAQFGGDPDNVTIMGESSGGVSVTALMISPLAEGLYSKAIAQSSGGTAVFPRVRNKSQSGEADRGEAGQDGVRPDGTRPDGIGPDGVGPGETNPEVTGSGFGVASGETTGSNWTSALGLGPNPSVDEMRAVSASTIATSGFFSFPNIDDVVLTRSPGDAFARGEQAVVPFLAGSNSFEASLPTITDAMAQASLPLNYAQFLDRYAERNASPLPPKEELRGELFFVQPTRFLVERHAAKGAASYLYYFVQVPEALRSSVPAATHGGELAYLFGNPLVPDSWDDADRQVSTRMMERWVAFARNGNPDITDARAWPAAGDQAGKAPAKALILGNSGGIREADALDQDMLDAAVKAAKFMWSQQ